ncbi:unnamed protein product, partial [Adineta ricciae]
KLQDDQDNNWDEYLQTVVFAYNTGVHKTTKYSPFELLYGRAARLPISIRPTSFSFSQPNDYFQQLQKTLRIFHRATRYNVLMHQHYTKQAYDRNRSDPHYSLDDLVLTRIHGARGKLDPRFSSIPKRITAVNHPTYVVQDIETDIISRVHVNDIRPLLVE